MRRSGTARIRFLAVQHRLDRLLNLLRGTTDPAVVCPAKSAADRDDERTTALPAPFGEAFMLAPQPAAMTTTTIATSHRSR
jgi:hypothetical protein